MHFMFIMKIKRIVVLEIPHGQESNQLIQHVHFDSYCYNHDAIFLNTKFLSLSQSVKSNIFTRLLTLILNNNVVRKTLIKLRIAEYHRFYAPEFRSSFFISKLTYVKGWYFRNLATFEMDKAFYTSEFNKKLQSEEYYKNHSPLKVALHIRRGDYEFFQDGRYFLNDSQYVTALRNVVSDINKPFEIIVFGNDPKLNRDIYVSLGYPIHFSDGSIYQDYYRMSKCKILIGPSSTFSIWAQWISNGFMKKIVIDKYNFNEVRISDAI
jgi:hypothetical protein